MSYKQENINLKYSGVKVKKKKLHGIQHLKNFIEQFQLIVLNVYRFCCFSVFLLYNKICNNVLCIDCYRSKIKIWNTQNFLEKLTSCGIYYYIDVEKQQQQQQKTTYTENIIFIDYATKVLVYFL